jgi:hypothetical protein
LPTINPIKCHRTAISIAGNTFYNRFCETHSLPCVRTPCADALIPYPRLTLAVECARLKATTRQHGRPHSSRCFPPAAPSIFPASDAPLTISYGPILSFPLFVPAEPRATSREHNRFL